MVILRQRRFTWSKDGDTWHYSQYGRPIRFKGQVDEEPEPENKSEEESKQPWEETSEGDVNDSEIDNEQYNVDNYDNNEDENLC